MTLDLLKRGGSEHYFNLLLNIVKVNFTLIIHVDKKCTWTLQYFLLILRRATSRSRLCLHIQVRRLLSSWINLKFWLKSFLLLLLLLFSFFSFLFLFLSYLNVKVSFHLFRMRAEGAEYVGRACPLEASDLGQLLRES